MSRGNVQVRAAGPADVEALVDLATEYRESVTGRSPRTPRPFGGGDPDTRARYRRLLADSAHRLVVAVDEDSGAVLGMAVFGVDVVSTLTGIPSIYVSHLLVSPRHRHRGAGRALLAAAVGYADDVGLDHVIVGVTSGGREANRFFARLGFAPLVLRRIAPVGALRRTLGLVDAVADARGHLARRPRTRSALPLPRSRARIRPLL